MSCKPAIQVTSLDKCYQLYAQPRDRLKQFLWRGKRQFYQEFWALRNINFSVMSGEVIGIVGRNGAGKSTLLQIICGTLTPSNGEVSVNGRVAALLELGAGFNPEFSGRENIFMSATIMGLSDVEIDACYEEIVEFSGIKDFIDQPVKTYSSGMYVRLAFSVAINVDPDILVIDEALSVGDGAFSRKSFDRIMALKSQGKTILFCTHSLYQIEMICDRAIWLDKGNMKMIGTANTVTNKYNQTLIEPKPESNSPTLDKAAQNSSINKGSARITNIRASVDGIYENPLKIQSQKSTFAISVQFNFDPVLSTPALAFTFCTLEGICISSTSTYHDNIDVALLLQKHDAVEVTFPNIPLLRGDYFINIYLMCENVIHVYDSALDAIQVTVEQEGTEQGFIMLPRHWTL